MSTWRESWFFFTMVGERFRPVLAREVRGGAAVGPGGAEVTITGSSGGVSMFSTLWLGLGLGLGVGLGLGWGRTVRASMHAVCSSDVRRAQQ